jgi:hypothetical protein
VEGLILRVVLAVGGGCRDMLGANCGSQKVQML